MSTRMTTGLTLTEEFQQALELLEGGSHLFLTGKAGTGKSTLIRLFTESTTKKIVVAAPTGVAALNVDGYTLHRLFSFPAGVTPELVVSDGYYPRRFASTLRSLDTLIIDEASMVRADLFDSIAAALTRFGPQPGTPFGGVQIILVGDLYQLPPVVTEAEQDYFSTRYASPFFFAADTYQQEDFPMIELTTVFRQDGDPEFLSILNVIRDGQATPAAVEALNSHVDEHFSTPTDEFWLTLTTQNRIADKRNREKLETLPTERFTSHAVTTGDLDGFEKPTQDVLNFKVGAQIMLLTNDPQDRWVNGTLAAITDIGRTDDGEYRVEIELHDQQRHIIQPHTWEITRPEVIGGSLTHRKIGSFQQLPFRLAWAVTIHKAQGLTLERCVIDLTGGAFADGQLYVALSRATSLTGLVLTRPVRPRDLRINQAIRRFHHTTTGGDHGQYVVLAANTVGDDGFQWRPRPIELAVILPDGTEMTTLINPQRDVGNTASSLGISAEDVVFAPTLPMAWAVIAPHLAGHLPVGYNLTETMGFIDFELKRHEQILHIPIGVEIQPFATRRVLRQLEQQGLSAIEQARLIRTLMDEQPLQEFPAATAFAPAEPSFGYLLPQTSDTTTRFIVDPTHTDALANHLGTLVQEAQHSPRLTETLRSVEKLTGHELIPADHETQRDGIENILVPGANICFTGEALDPTTGDPIDRSHLETLAQQRGLITEGSVTKSRTIALIVADLGTQSNKAKNARRWEKPVYSVEAFLDWVNGNTTQPAQPDVVEVQVVFEPFPDNNVVLEETVSTIEPAGEEPPTERVIPWSQQPIAEVLVPDAVVSATGTILDPTNGTRVIQSDLAKILGQHDLVYERNVTQKRTSLLLVGETDKITRQIDTAVEYGKPIYPATAFFDWLQEQELQEHLVPQTPPAPEPVPQAPPEPVNIAPRPQPQPQPATPTKQPWWVTMPNGKFYGLAAGLPLGLLLIIPIILITIGVIVPAAEPVTEALAIASILGSFLAVPVVLTFIGLRISGRRRNKPTSN